MTRLSRIGLRIVFALAILGVLSAAILTRAPKPLKQFDQPFYFSVASDLIHYGTFSNGWIGKDERTSAGPVPGMFFGPVYPAMIVAVAKLDPHFAATVDCGAEAYARSQPCDVYVRPMLIIHAVLLTLGVLAVARAGEILFKSTAMFWTVGVVATGALLADADQFSFVMTEATTFSLYSLTMLAMVLGWTTSARRYFVLAGLAAGVLCLTRMSFLVAALLLPVLIVINSRFFSRPRRGWADAGAGVLAFAVAFAAVILPWAARNAVSVGKLALTEEYGSLALIERLAYDQMTAREFALAFPYCLPKIGPTLVDEVFGSDAMWRFDYQRDGGFYNVGMLHRDQLVIEFKRVDPVIGRVLMEEMKDNWWRYILVSIPLAWCGMWVGGWLGLLIVPTFFVACVEALRVKDWRSSRPLLLLYAVPPLAMLGLHAALASFYTRYNLALIGPFSVATAWLIVSLAARWRNPAPTPPPVPSQRPTA
jgi:hypothetical protein